MLTLAHYSSAAALLDGMRGPNPVFREHACCFYSQKNAVQSKTPGNLRAADEAGSVCD
jgi:hypothetical protein